MIKITALLLAVLLTVAIIPTIPLTVTKAQNDTAPPEATQLPVLPDENVTMPPPAMEGNETQPEAPATSEPSAIQIQLIPSIQRGHNQHLSLFLVDDQGNVILDRSMQANITNEKGNFVGPGSITTESGRDEIYKVGPNTRPQNISVFATLLGDNITASEQYSVFAKITQPIKPNVTQTNETEPTEPPVNVTEPIEGNITAPIEGNITAPIEGNITAPPSNQTGNITAPPVNATVPIEGNVTGPIEGNITGPPQNTTITPPESGNGNSTTEPEQPPANATSSFEQLENSTAILEQEIEQGDENGNETDRAEVKTAVSETLNSLGQVASEVATATNFQLGTIGATAEAVADAIDQILN